MVQTTCVEETNNNKANENQLHGFEVSTIPYSESQPTNQESWNGHFSPISIFGSNEAKSKDLDNIKSLFYCIADFIKNQPLKK